MPLRSGLAKKGNGQGSHFPVQVAVAKTAAAVGREREAEAQRQAASQLGSRVLFCPQHAAVEADRPKAYCMINSSSYSHEHDPCYMSATCFILLGAT